MKDKECRECTVEKKLLGDSLASQLPGGARSELWMYEDYLLNKKLIELSLTFALTGTFGATVFALGPRRIRSVFLLSGLAGIIGSYSTCLCKLCDTRNLEWWLRKGNCSSSCGQKQLAAPEAPLSTKAQSTAAVQHVLRHQPAELKVQPKHLTSKVGVPKPRFAWFNRGQAIPSHDFDLSFDKDDYSPSDFRRFHDNYIAAYFPELVGKQ